MFRAVKQIYLFLLNILSHFPAWNRQKSKLLQAREFYRPLRTLHWGLQNSLNTYTMQYYLKRVIKLGANKRRLLGVMMRFSLMRHDNSPGPCGSLCGCLFYVVILINYDWIFTYQIVASLKLLAKKIIISCVE